MAFDSIAQNLDVIRAKSASNSFFVSQVETRGQNVLNFIVEAWNIIVALGETLKNVLGVAVRTLLWLPRKIVSLSFIENLNGAMPKCPDVANSIVKAGQLFVGLISTALLGVALNPNWNYSVHVRVGIVPSQRNNQPAAAAVVT